jgi:hypothetical protein
MADSKRQGIYILGNDRIIDDAIAFMNSVQQHAPNYPVALIPYDTHYHNLARILRDRYGVEVFEDRALFDEIDRHTQALLGWKPPMCRKFACWSGPFDEFIYFDTDILVFQDQADLFDLLTEYDIVTCAEGRYTGIQDVFTEQVLMRNLFTQQEISELFNAGFFASKKQALDRVRMVSLLEQAVAVKDIFIPHHQDQTILNYLVLVGMPKRANLREYAPAIPDDAYAGLEILQVKGNQIYKYGHPVRFIHWCGYKEIPRRPHVSLWLKYRYSGRLGALQRLLVRLWWWIDRLANRLLCTQTENWYQPMFQVKRFRRIVTSLFKG